MFLECKNSTDKSKNIFNSDLSGFIFLNNDFAYDLISVILSNIPKKILIKITMFR